VNWPDYVVLAERLVGDPCEASKRSAVSRAYYGTLNVSRQWLEAKVAPIDRYRVHAEVWGTFRTRGGFGPMGTRRESKLVADLGDKMRVLRNQADYDDSFPNLDEHAVEALNAEKEVLAVLAKLEPVD
jgi:hypothetical protein